MPVQKSTSLKKRQPSILSSRSRSETLKPAVTGQIGGSATYVDLVRDQRNPLQIRLLGKPKLHVLSPELARSAHVLALPRKPVAFGTIGELFRDIGDILHSYAELADESADLLSFAVIATWFPECVPVAPSVVISGSAVEAQPLLRVLRCLCRHGFLVVDLTPAALTSPVMQLVPTLIMHHQHMNDRLARLLSASSSAGCFVVGRGEPRTIFCSKIIFTEIRVLPTALDRTAVHVSVCPTTRPTRLNSERLQQIEEKFQNGLLAYRMAVRDRVAGSDFDVPIFATEMRLLARTLGACIVDDAEIQGKIVDLLRPQDADNRIAHGADIRCLVIEAVLFHAREGKKNKLFVGEIAQTVNDLRRCRDEPTSLSARAVGQQLTELGFLKQRGAPGFYIPCGAETEEFVENLARKYQVLSAVVGNAGSPGETPSATTTQ